MVRLPWRASLTAAGLWMAWGGLGRATPTVVREARPFDPNDVVALERAPLITPERTAHYVSSYDRTGGNDDGFRGTYSALYVDERGEHVLFDERGPGVVSTLWFTSREDGWSPLGWGRIRFYFDDEEAPRIDLAADELFDGRHPPFVAPLVSGPFASTGGHVSYVPLPFATRLKIATTRRVGFYNVFYSTFTSGAPLQSWTRDLDLRRLSAAWSAAGQDPKHVDGQRTFSGTLELAAPRMPDGEMTPVRERLLDLTGPGTITSLRVNPLFPLTAYQLNHILLRVYWDDETTPAIDAPLGSFFGSGLGEADVRGLPLGMSSAGTYYCYWPMPFWKNARLELQNETPGPVPRLWWQVEVASPPALVYGKEDAGYFHAQYRREWPPRGGEDYLLLDTAGRGTYLGQVMTVEPLRPEVKRWWEGDLRVWIDGRRHPAFQGTGHEDEYLGGWSNEWLMNPYSLPLHGEPKTVGLTQVDFQWNAATTVYRFFPGGIPFESSLRLSTEHGASNQVPAMYSSVAYYYLQPSRMAKVDEVDVGSEADERRHDYRASPTAAAVEARGRFEASTTELADRGREIAGRSEFSITVPADHRYVRLRRVYDQRHRQQAEVWVNGAPAGTWSTTATNADRIWAESDFALPKALTRGQSRLRVEIRANPGAWSEYRYEVFAIR